MNAFNPIYFLFLLHLCENASIHKTNNTLEILKKDVAEMGSAIENFTFDILEDIIDESDEETSTDRNHRGKRSIEDDVKSLCQKRCEDFQTLETKQINELKTEMKKLRDVVELLQDQQKIINILDKKNSTSTSVKQSRTDLEIDDNDNTHNLEELSKIKNELKELTKHLNETRKVITFQQAKDKILEDELKNQKKEIENLKLIVDNIHKNVTMNGTEENLVENSRLSSRASDLTSIRKLLKSLPEDDDDDDLSSKLAELQKHLDKKRRQQSLLQELKHLEKTLDDSDTDSDSNLLRQIIKAIKKTEVQSRSDDPDITNLSDLEDAINRLRPKENDATQFQNLLNKIMNKPTNQRPVPFTTQQMNEFTKKLTLNNYPYVCVIDDGSPKNSYYKPVNYRNFPNIDYSKNQFFPNQFAPQNYNTDGNIKAESFGKSFYYQGENGDYDQKYQEELRQEIDGLQAAIDNLNRSEYSQKPEDKAVVDGLERQIGDLRNIVNNLNHDSKYRKAKRSLDNNEVEDSKEMIEKMRSFVDTILNKNETNKTELVNIQQKINLLKSKIDDINPKIRAATQYDNPFQLDASKDLQRSFKGDFFADIISKILEKVISAIPAIIQKLFNFSFEQLSKYDNQDYDIQVLFKNLGIFAYLPVVLLRILRGITAFLNMLRKNTFFKNFLMPAIILGTIAGSVLFLIWWLQPEENYSNFDQNYQTDPYYNQYSTNNQPVSYNYPVYNRSYFNK